MNRIALGDWEMEGGRLLENEDGCRETSEKTIHMKETKRGGCHREVMESICR